MWITRRNPLRLSQLIIILITFGAMGIAQQKFAIAPVVSANAYRHSVISDLALPDSG